MNTKYGLPCTQILRVLAGINRYAEPASLRPQYEIQYIIMFFTLASAASTRNCRLVHTSDRGVSCNRPPKNLFPLVFHSPPPFTVRLLRNSHFLPNGARQHIFAHPPTHTAKFIDTAPERTQTHAHTHTPNHTRLSRRRDSAPTQRQSLTRNQVVALIQHSHTHTRTHAHTFARTHKSCRMRDTRTAPSHTEPNRGREPEDQRAASINTTRHEEEDDDKHAHRAQTSPQTGCTCACARIQREAAAVQHAKSTRNNTRNNTPTNQPLEKFPD